jgi:hypothetical protein
MRRIAAGRSPSVSATIVRVLWQRISSQLTVADLTVAAAHRPHPHAGTENPGTASVTESHVIEIANESATGTETASVSVSVIAIATTTGHQGTRELAAMTTATMIARGGTGRKKESDFTGVALTQVRMTVSPMAMIVRLDHDVAVRKMKMTTRGAIPEIRRYVSHLHITDNA